MPSVAAVVVGLALLGGGSVGLAPTDEPPAVPSDSSGGDGSVADDPAAPAPAPSPTVPGVIGLGTIAAALALLQRRDGELSPGAALGLRSTDPTFVFVPGHGQPPGDRAFRDLVAMMGLDQDDVRYFDYRWVGGTDDHPLASEHVTTDDAASALNAYLAAIAEDERPIYLVGFSKGGATIAELVADWDEGRWGPSDAVVGAALLDPPIARGPLGRLQSLGRHVGAVPDDGGYEPVRCSFLGFGCRDAREHLGEASGVEVVVVRNPRAAITSFGDVPDGLRVYDASDGGRGPWDQLLHNPFRFPGRIGEAHTAVLHDPRVASCIVAESQSPGACDLSQRGRRPLPGLSGGATRAPTGQKVV